MREQAAGWKDGVAEGRRVRILPGSEILYKTWSITGVASDECGSKS